MGPLIIAFAAGWIGRSLLGQMANDTGGRTSVQGYRGRVGDPSLSDGPAPGFVDNGDGTATPIEGAPGTYIPYTGLSASGPVSYDRSWEIWSEFNGQGGPELGPFDPNAPIDPSAFGPTVSGPSRKRRL